MSEPVHITQFDGLSTKRVGDTLAALLGGDKQAVALIYQPDACIIARVTKDGFSTPKGSPDLDAAYEMLVFCSDWEFRWVRNGATGNATLVAKTAQQIAGEKPLQAYGIREVFYLLWGDPPREGPKIADGWVTLSSARVGAIKVPVSMAAEKYALQAYEYAFTDEHGNVTVGLQRCAAIVPWREGEPRKNDARGQGETHG